MTKSGLQQETSFPSLQSILAELLKKSVFHVGLCDCGSVWLSVLRSCLGIYCSKDMHIRLIDSKWSIDVPLDCQWPCDEPNLYPPTGQDRLQRFLRAGANRKLDGWMLLFHETFCLRCSAVWRLLLRSQTILKFLHLCFSPRWWHRGDPGLQHALSTTAGSALPQPLNVAPSCSLSSSSFFVLLPSYHMSFASFLPAKGICSSVIGFSELLEKLPAKRSTLLPPWPGKLRPEPVLVESRCGKRLLVNILETDREISLFIYNKPPRRELSKEALMTF